MTIDRDEGTFIYTHKKRSGFLNKTLINTCLCCNIFENAFYCTELRTTWPTDSMRNTIWDFICFCFWKNIPLPPPNPPILTLSYWPSFTVTTQLEQLSTWYVRQYSTVSNSKETYIICNMTVFFGEEETNTLEVPNEWSERKSQK